MSLNIKFSSYFGKGGIPERILLTNLGKEVQFDEKQENHIAIHSLSSSTLKAQGTSQKQNCFLDTQVMAEEILFPVLKIHQLFLGVIPLRCALSR